MLNNDYLFLTYHGLIVYSLVFFRVAAICFMMPFLGAENVSARIRVGIFMALSLALYPFAKQHFMDIPIFNMGYMLSAFAFEIFVGALLGYIANFVFQTVIVGGEVIGFNMSFAMAKSLDPNQGLQLTVVTNLYTIVTNLFFISSGAFLFFIQTLMMSFYKVSFSSTIQVERLSQLLVELTKNILLYGLKMALPIIVVSLLINILLGVLTKMVSGLNVFLMSLNIRIAAGLVIFVLSLPVIFKIIQSLINMTFVMLDRAFLLL